MKHIFLFLFCIPILSLAQSISPSVCNTIGTTFQTSYAGIDINIGESITGPIANTNSQITQGLLQPNNFTLNLKFYLEGFYTGSGLMDNNGMGGCLYKIGASTNPNNVDSVQLTLIDKTSHEKVETAFAILQTDGMADFYFHGATEGNYYLKLNHRNTIETWSANPVLLTNEGSYDFTISANKAYGNNMTETYDHNGWAFFSGDIANTGSVLGGIVGLQDGIVAASDYTELEIALYYTMTGYAQADITGDGIVESADYVLMENNQYYTAVVIHP